jgi:hypothetical protein
MSTDHTDADEDAAPRPFRLRDRVRITHHWTEGDEVHEGVVHRIAPVKGHPDVMRLTITTDEPWTQKDGSVVQNDSITLTLDCTAERWSHASIELLPDAPDVVAAPDPAPVSYLVAERRAGKWLIGDDWSTEHDTLDEARAYLQRSGGPERGYHMGILAVTLVEELR